MTKFTHSELHFITILLEMSVQETDKEIFTSSERKKELYNNRKQLLDKALKMLDECDPEYYDG